MHAGSGWRYAPRPGRRPVASTTTPPSERRTRRTSWRLPASSRQATQVLTGCRRASPTVLVRLAGLDVDPVAGQLRSQPGVLPVAADRERELAARHEHRRRAGHAVDGHPVGPCRAERRRDKGLRILRPGHDVDVLVGELAEDRAVPHALRPDARPDRVEAGLRGRNRDLRPQAGFPRDDADLDGPGLDLWHLGLEQAVDEGAGGARDAHLGLAPGVLRLEDYHQHRTPRANPLPPGP